MILGPDGRPQKLKIQRALGMGLDEKALEAVKQWRFEPAKKDGVPVAVRIQIDVDFHLY
jgi:TonB family protein